MSPFPGTPEDVARILVEGFANDQCDDVEIHARIAHVIEGERQRWHSVFSFYLTRAELAARLQA